MSVTRSLPSTSANDDARWRAVLRRDRRADGKFFFGVATTGVYCRASCSARRPHRKHVTFFETAADAEKAGFRACRRCHPNGPSLTERQAALVAAACRRIETAEEVPDLDTLAKSAGLSRFHFHRLFKTATGMTPKAYATAHRSERMRAELGRRKTVTEAIYEAGFNSNGRFYANSSGMLGMKPKDYRNGGRGAAIRFAVGKCSLGSILVAASEKGICAIFLGDDPAALTKDLAKRFPKAQLIAADRNISRSRRQGDPIRRGSADRFGSAARSTRNRFSAPSLGGSSRDPHRHDLELFGDRQAHRRTKVSSRRCAGNCFQPAGGCRPLPSCLVPGRKYFRLSLGRRTQAFPAERANRSRRKLEPECPLLQGGVRAR